MISSDQLDALKLKVGSMAQAEWFPVIEQARLALRPSTTLQEIANILNRLQRYDLVARNYWQDMEENDWGDWIKADDLAAAFGLKLDSVLDEKTNSCLGFRKEK